LLKFDPTKRVFCTYNLIDLIAVRSYVLSVEIEFDRAKGASNIAKHGVSLAFGARLFDDPAYLVLPSIRPIDGEDRFKVVGMADGKLYTAVYVRRGAVTRFISVRRSNEGEQRHYDRHSG